MNLPVADSHADGSFIIFLFCPVAGSHRLQQGARRWINSRSGIAVKLITGAGFQPL